MRALLAEVANKPTITRLNRQWILSRCAKDNPNWTSVTKKLNKVNDNGLALEVPAHTAAQNTIYDLLQLQAVSIIKQEKSGSITRLERTNNKYHQFEDALYLLQPAAQFDLFRQRIPRYEGAHPKFDSFQGKFVTDHTANGQEHALQRVMERMKRETPQVQTIIETDAAFDVFNNQLRSLRKSGFFDKFFGWLTNVRGPSLLAKGHQINTVLFTSPLVNVWTFEFNALTNGYRLPPQFAPKVVVYAMTTETGERRLVYHLESTLEQGQDVQKESWQRKVINSEKLSGYKVIAPQIVALMQNMQIVVEYQRP